MPLTKYRYPGVQLLRALLFVTIVAFHCRLWGTWIFWGGIEIFFVISAYFLTKKLIKKDYNPFLEIGHRVCRLYPVYVFVILFCFLYIFLTEHILGIKDLGLHLLFSQNINWMATKYQSTLVYVTGHTWTLSIEMYAFLIYVFGFKLCKGKTSRIIFNAVAIVVAITWRTVLTLTVGEALITSVCPLAHIDAFALGSLLALLEDSKKLNKRAKDIILGAIIVAGIAMIVGCMFITSKVNGVSFFEAFHSYEYSDNYFNHPFTSNLYLGFSILGVGFLYFLKKINFNSKFFIPFLLLGNISYSAYLIHFPIYRILSKYIDSLWLVFGITLLLTITLSFFVEWVIKLIKYTLVKIKHSKEKHHDIVV